MSEKNDKWTMFKNYIHNELGITKDDIRAWLKEAVQSQAELMLKKTFDDFDIFCTQTYRNANEILDYRLCTPSGS